MTPYPYKRILILGAAGRGKSTFAGKLSARTGIPMYETDDFFWKVKFTERNEREQSVADIAKVYATDSWIVEGATRRLLVGGIERADIIFYLQFNSIIPQYYYLVKRSLYRTNERLIDLWELLKHVTNQKYTKGYRNHMPSFEELLAPHRKKVIEFRSFREIDRYLASIK